MRSVRAEPPAYNSPVPSNEKLAPTVDQPRILGLDVGTKTIGVAVSDPLGITAQGLDTIRRKNKRHDFECLEELTRKYDVREFVVGYPTRLSGAPSAQTERVEVFVQDLRRRFGLPVHFWDERLTSVEAGRLLRESEMSIRRRGEVVDRLAAVLILQGFLDRRRAGV